MFQLDLDKDEGEGCEEDHVDSPKFADSSRPQHHFPVFGESYNEGMVSFDKKQSQQTEEKRKLERIKQFVKIQLKISKLVILINSKRLIWSLSGGFRAISDFSSSRANGINIDCLLSQQIKVNFKILAKIIGKGCRLNKQSGFLSISNYSIIKRNQTLNQKKLQAFDTRKYHETLLKQNQDRDNMNALEIQNTYLKKQILKQERQQNVFIDNMNQLLEKYEISETSQVSTHRPYLTSFGSSPQPFQERKKMTSKGGQRKMKASKKY